MAVWCRILLAYTLVLFTGLGNEQAWILLQMAAVPAEHPLEEANHGREARDDADASDPATCVSTSSLLAIWLLDGLDAVS